MRLIGLREWSALTVDEHRKVRTVSCGPDCPYCGKANKGIAVVTTLDEFGDVYPEASGVILMDDEWVVFTLDPDSPVHQREAARYPRDGVVGFRNLPATSLMLGHWVLDEEPANA